MQFVDKAEYRSFLKKGQQHEKAAHWSLKEGEFDAAITNFCIALINYLDALSVNRFGRNLSSDSHEGAPALLQKQLNGIGISDFRSFTKDCVGVLKLKNIAAYRSKPLSKKDATFAGKVTEKIRAY